MSATLAVEYKDVPGFLGYRVGADGSVWSRRVRGGKSSGRLRREWKIMKPTWKQKSEQYGQLYVTLRGSRVKQLHLGKVVLLSFVGPPHDGMECCHRDGNTR